jgi:hypothetical protein
MPLTFATPPQGGKVAVIKGLQDVAPASTLVGVAAAAAGPAGLRVMEPFPVYSLGLSALVSNGLDAAHLIGWRYLIVAGQNVVQAAEIFTPQKGGALELSSLTTGHAREMEDVLRNAEALPQVAQGDYEIRALRVPALYVTALWLKGLQKNRDLFLMVPPLFPPFNDKVPYDRDDFLKLLKAAAAKTVQPGKSP